MKKSFKNTHNSHYILVRCKSTEYISLWHFGGNKVNTVYHVAWQLKQHTVIRSKKKRCKLSDTGAHYCSHIVQAILHTIDIAKSVLLVF